MGEAYDCFTVFMKLVVNTCCTASGLFGDDEPLNTTRAVDILDPSTVCVSLVFFEC